MKQRVCGDEEMGRFAAEYAAGLVPKEDGATVMALSGELGAGKTTFVRGVLRSYGVEESVTSPTFVIEKMYTPPRGPFKKVVHVDAYRLESGRELERLGFSELLKDVETLILVEWPEKAEGVIPKDAKRVRIEIGDGAERFIVIN